MVHSLFLTQSAPRSRLAGYPPRSHCPKTFSVRILLIVDFLQQFENTKNYDQRLQGARGGAMKRFFGQRGSHGFVWTSLAALLVGSLASPDRDVEAALVEPALADLGQAAEKPVAGAAALPIVARIARAQAFLVGVTLRYTASLSGLRPQAEAVPIRCRTGSTSSLRPIAFRRSGTRVDVTVPAVSGSRDHIRRGKHTCVACRKLVDGAVPHGLCGSDESVTWGAFHTRPPLASA
jgi:hypothetical protein